MDDDTGTKVCPQCAEEVKAAARICRFCHYDFAATTATGTPAADGQAASTRGAAAGAQEAAQRRMGRAVLTGLIVFAVAAAGVVFIANQLDPGLSDAQATWCRANDAAVRRTARSLGIDEGTILMADLAFQNGNAPSGETRRAYNRACIAAFGAR
jgi:Uncharacterised protein family UPF0547